ncbi:holin [Pseudomonas phage vB_PpuP-Kurepalu-1]
MQATEIVDVAVRNAPPVAVAGASATDWFMSIPMSNLVQAATLVWIVIQAGFYLYDRIKKAKNGSDK